MQSVTSNAVYNGLSLKVNRIRANIHNEYFNYFSDFSGIPFEAGVNGLLIIQSSEFHTPCFIGFITYKYQDINSIYKLAGELTPNATNLIGTIDFGVDLLGYFAELIVF